MSFNYAEAYLSGVVNMASFNMEPSHMEVICTEKENMIEKLVRDYKVPRDKIELTEVELRFEEYMRELLRIDDKALREITYLITKTAGKPLRMYELTERSHTFITDHHTLLPFFFVEYMFFVEFEKMMICFITGNFE